MVIYVAASLPFLSRGNVRCLVIFAVEVEWLVLHPLDELFHLTVTIDPLGGVVVVQQLTLSERGVDLLVTYLMDADRFFALECAGDQVMLLHTNCAERPSADRT